MKTHTDTRTSLSYLTRREQQERALAARSSEAMIRHIHLDLADRYAALARTPQALAA